MTFLIPTQEQARHGLRAMKSVLTLTSGALEPAQRAALDAIQKHLLRTGPRNVRVVQSALRQLSLALGIPAERLRRR